MIVSDSPARSLPPFLVCGECAEPVTGTEGWEVRTSQPCGHTAETHRVCLTWAMARECRCATAFHDTHRIISATLPWLAVLVQWHIIQARGE